MLILNYDKIYKKHDSSIDYYAKKISYDNFKDNAQDIRLYIYMTLNNFCPSKASLNYYINVLIITSYRKLIYDKKRQQIFEESFCGIRYDVARDYVVDNYGELVSEVVTSIKAESEIVVFYAILYNNEGKNYVEIAKFLNMTYAAFIRKVSNIKNITQQVLDKNQ